LLRFEVKSNDIRVKWPLYSCKFYKISTLPLLTNKKLKKLKKKMWPMGYKGYFTILSSNLIGKMLILQPPMDLTPLCLGVVQ